MNYLALSGAQADAGKMFRILDRALHGGPSLRGAKPDRSAIRVQSQRDARLGKRRQGVNLAVSWEDPE